MARGPTSSWSGLARGPPGETGREPRARTGIPFPAVAEARRDLPAGRTGLRAAQRRRRASARDSGRPRDYARRRPDSVRTGMRVRFSAELDEPSCLAGTRSCARCRAAATRATSVADLRVIDFLVKGSDPMPGMVFGQRRASRPRSRKDHQPHEHRVRSTAASRCQRTRRAQRRLAALLGAHAAAGQHGVQAHLLRHGARVSVVGGPAAAAVRRAGRGLHPRHSVSATRYRTIRCFLLFNMVLFGFFQEAIVAAVGSIVGQEGSCVRHSSRGWRSPPRWWSQRCSTCAEHGRRVRVHPRSRRLAAGGPGCCSRCCWRCCSVMTRRSR